MPGTQQLDAMARASGTLPSFDHVTNSPVSASTAVQMYGFAGHSPSRDEIARSGTSRATPPRSSRPSRRGRSGRCRREAVAAARRSVELDELLHQRAEIEGAVRRAARRCFVRDGVLGGEQLRRRTAERQHRAHDGAGGRADEEISVDEATPSCSRPAASPTSHATPTGPPPPSTSARVTRPPPAGMLLLNRPEW